MGLEYEKKKYEVLKKMFNEYKEELLQDRLRALDMPIETEVKLNWTEIALWKDQFCI